MRAREEDVIILGVSGVLRPDCALRPDTVRGSSRLHRSTHQSHAEAAPGRTDRTSSRRLATFGRCGPPSRCHSANDVRELSRGRQPSDAEDHHVHQPRILRLLRSVLGHNPGTDDRRLFQAAVRRGVRRHVACRSRRSWLLCSRIRPPMTSFPRLLCGSQSGALTKEPVSVLCCSRLSFQRTVESFGVQFAVVWLVVPDGPGCFLLRGVHKCTLWQSKWCLNEAATVTSPLFQTVLSEHRRIVQFAVMWLAVPDGPWLLSFPKRP